MDYWGDAQWGTRTINQVARQDKESELLFWAKAAAEMERSRWILAIWVGGT